MKQKFYLFVTCCATLTLVACTDDTGIHSHDYSDGLYFQISSNDWSANGTRATRVASIQEMESSVQLDQPLYLHCEVTEGIIPSTPQDSSAQTRAIRYTGPVFNDSYGVTSFGIYGTVGAKTAFDGTEVFTRDEFSGTDGGSGGNGHRTWREKDSQTINEYWLDGETGNFYGFAPSPYEGGGSVNSCISVNLAGTPTLTYDMPADAAYQRDVLTAKREGVSKAEKNEFGIELEFVHVLAALRFKVADATDGLTWHVQGTTYYVQPKTIAINDIYSKGSCPILTQMTSIPGHWTKQKADPGDADYQKCALTTCTISQTRAQILANGGLITPDENCFMVLPQEIATGVKAVITCDLYDNAACTGAAVKENVRIEAPLYGANGSDPWGNGKFSWCPGYTYTYTISDIDVAYMFDWDDATDFGSWYTERSYDNVNTSATLYNNGAGDLALPKQEIFIRSYKMDSKGNKTPVQWEIFHEEEGTATAVGGNGTTTADTYKEGAHEWIHLYDKSSGSYDTEVTGTHDGARDIDADKVDANYFELVIGDIMTPVIDLSLWNYDQTKKWTGRTTSNCYIVAGPGTYRIPLIYGNAYMNGSENTTAWKPLNPGANALSTFLNHKGYEIASPFINVDLGQHVSKACLIWEEGVGTNSTTRQSTGSTYPHSTTTNSTEDPENKYKHKYNIGTVVKVIEDLDDYRDAPDGYNTTSGFGYPGKYLQFEVSADNFKYGNAVVGILDDEDNIVWSWHIWITDPTMFTTDQTVSLDGHEVTFAGTNIGWVTGGESVPQKDRTGKIRLKQKESGKTIDIDATQVKCNAFTSYFTNCLYQFGRKDPMRGNVDKADQETDYGSPRGDGGYQAWANKYTSPDNTYTTVGNAIRNPNWIYGTSDGDLYSSSAIDINNKSYCNLWAANLQETNQAMWGSWKFYGKTIYDPSPVGYCVPPSRFMMTFARSGYRDKFEEIGNGATSPITCTYTNGSDVVKFYSQGLRSTTNGIRMKSRGFDDVATGLSHYANAFYHTATPYSRDENFQLHLYFYSLIDTHNKILGDHCEALSIMPVKWNGAAASYAEEDQTEKYLTFTFLGSGALYWANNSTTDQNAETIEYSINDGTWTSVTSTHSGDGTLISNTLKAGDKIRIRGDNDSYYASQTVLGVTTNYYHYFYSTAAYELSGNIMSMIDPDPATFKTMTALPDGSSYNFYRLFSYVTSSNNKLMAADELVLPATTLRAHCYHSMFEGCNQLEIAPNLPATTGATDCYQEMFEDCSSLQSVYCMLASPSDDYTHNWLNRVNSEGQFYYKKGVTWPTNSGLSIVYGVPSGWTQYPSDEE